jgi:hypothetical protein
VHNFTESVVVKRRTSTDVAKELGIAPGTVRDYRSSGARKIKAGKSLSKRERQVLQAFGELESLTAGVDQEVDSLEDLRLRRLEDENARLKRIIKERQREDVTAALIRETAFKLSKEKIVQPEWLKNVPDRKGNAGTPTLLLSDLHWGEVVDPEQVFGLNEYNLEIARRRLERVVERTVDLCRHHVVNDGTPGLCLPLGGDMVSGAIHEELSFTDELPPAACVKDLADHLAAAISYFLDEFEWLYIPCVTGNHGRTTRKVWSKHRAFTSWDWMLYTMLEREFKDDERVQFEVSQSTDVLYELAGTRYLLTHGDKLAGVRGGNGIIGAIGPISRGTVKKRAQSAAVGRGFDVCIMGHWHQHIVLRDKVVNNTLKGVDEWSLQQGYNYSPPSQAIWWTHPKRGVTLSAEVFADDSPIRPDGGVVMVK